VRKSSTDRAQREVDGVPSFLTLPDERNVDRVEAVSAFDVVGAVAAFERIVSELPNSRSLPPFPCCQSSPLPPNSSSPPASPHLPTPPKPERTSPKRIYHECARCGSRCKVVYRFCYSCAGFGKRKPGP
jgi:hypothetical protein